MSAEWVLLRLGHASLWGGLFIVMVAAVCRLAPLLPAPVRAWLWWLACLKLVFDLCGAAPIALPVLPAPAIHLAPAPAPSPVRPVMAVQAPAASPVSQPIMPPANGDIHAAQSPLLLHVSWPLGLFALWLAGVMLSLAVLLRQGFRLAQIVRAASRVTLNGVDINALASAIGLRSAPRVLQHPAVAAPCVTGPFRPAILLPPGLSDTLSPEELRLALAHEMAHIRRGDLLLAILPALAHILFFFHPLVWWTGTEWAAAREEACDGLALQTTGASTAHYGHLLLKMASGETNATALGLSSGYHGLRRRLLGLTQAARESRRPLARWLLACVLPLLLPWRLTAAVHVSPTSPAPLNAAPAGYQITDLGVLAESDISALNDAGQIAGTTAGRNDLTHGFVGNGGQVQPLGALPKHHASIAYGLNNRGQVAAASYNIPGRGRAFLFDGVRHRLGSLPGFPYSEAHGVNDAGQVAGFAETGGHDRWQAQIARAFRWADGEMTDLGTLGGAYSYAYGISNSGVVVGKADTSVFGQTHAFAWSEGQMQDLGTLGGANSLAYRINDRGQITGYSETGTGETRHAFFYADGLMRDLGALPGFEDSVAYDLNNAGDAVGSAAPAPDASGQCALLWHDSHVIDLNRLLPFNSGWTLDEARAINDRGQIAGQGHFHGQPRAFLLTPR